MSVGAIFYFIRFLFENTDKSVELCFQNFKTTES